MNGRLHHGDWPLSGRHQQRLDQDPTDACPSDSRRAVGKSHSGQYRDTQLNPHSESIDAVDGGIDQGNQPVGDKVDGVGQASDRTGVVEVHAGAHREHRECEGPEQHYSRVRRLPAQGESAKDQQSPPRVCGIHELFSAGLTDPAPPLTREKKVSQRHAVCLGYIEGVQWTRMKQAERSSLYGIIRADGACDGCVPRSSDDNRCTQQDRNPSYSLSVCDQPSPIGHTKSTHNEPCGDPMRPARDALSDQQHTANGGPLPPDFRPCFLGGNHDEREWPDDRGFAHSRSQRKG